MHDLPRCLHIDFLPVPPADASNALRHFGKAVPNLRYMLLDLFRGFTDPVRKTVRLRKPERAIIGVWLGTAGRGRRKADAPSGNARSLGRCRQGQPGHGGTRGLRRRPPAGGGSSPLRLPCRGHAQPRRR